VEDASAAPLKKKKFDSYRESLKDLGLISTVEQFF
jgi:hypothetical protein